MNLDNKQPWAGVDLSLKINGCDPTVRKCAPEPFHSIQMKLKLACHFLQKSTRWRLSWFNMHQIKRQTHV